MSNLPGVLRPPITGVSVGITMVAAVAAVLSGCSQDALQVASSQTTPSFHQVSARPTPSPGAGTVSLRHVDLSQLVLADPRTPKDLRDQVEQCGGFCGVVPQSHVHITGIAGDAVLADVDGYNGPVGGVVVAAVGGRPAVVFMHSGTDASIQVRDGLLVLTRDMYAVDDPESKPSGPAEVSTYTWSGQRFVLQSRTGGGARYSPYLPTDQVVS